MSDLTAFRRTCFLAAGRTGGKVSEFRISDGVTPNFHQGIIIYRNRTVAVVLARDTTAVAIAVPRSIDFAPAREAGPLTFVDDPELATALTENGKFRVLTPAELDGPFDATQWPGISSYDLRSWKPDSTGEALFNYWD